ncbi:MULTISPECIES: ABC transporter permease [Butyricimonas]|uniref:ABC transporter permease n=1 Tax=Butyricimonas TaxID=574697 RepID=UPI00208318CB|nr:ABC transporter permease [Butyricimonas paravirosa]BDF57167.1 multidrug ABC transporter substrate-binding protein [Odoribacteraceae bacterium]GKH96030.1 multidrug ABC transporter substrate-binding protein [Odoribacteraceae bacterium]GKH98666.1 multidrug ABC transporter substrate-binding protein [Odoribacteraceae bacterium]GKI04094.1 multidrug ABC transporter substrate-binding protein [Odoribacteraceae bacterium]
MNYGNLIVIALRALSNNKLRGFLTMLGIIIGVSSVISMLAIGEGSKRSIEKQIEELGANMIVVNPTNAMVGGIRQNGVIVQTLELKDYQAIMSEVPYLESCSPYVTKSGQAIYGPNNTPTSIYGINEDYMEIRRLSVAKGEMFSDQDMKMAAKVCVVGQTIVDNLFKNGEDPLGQVIRFDKVPFRIVGVLAPKGYNSMGRDQDDIIVAPFTTIQKRLLAIPYMHGIYVSVADKKYTNKVIREITGVLRQTHGISGTQEEDFTVRSLEEMSSVLTMATKVLTILLACIGGISLLVGGIGIMNIMYVSVTERTREIGLRMSIGAKGRHILFQFLIESIIISVSGGIIGVALGVGVALALRSLLGWPVSVLLYSVIISFLVCTFTGIFFGWYPARKASRLNPIDAIRYE